MKRPEIIIPAIILLIVTLCVITTLLFMRATVDFYGLDEEEDGNTVEVKVNDEKNLSNEPYVSWNFINDEWAPTNDPEDCNLPIELTIPVDINKVTALLYPGQYRGDDYKAHGGFRFGSSKSSDIAVIAPIDAHVFRGSRYLQDGELQYWFDFVTSCGLMYRFDHLSSISQKLEELADTLPEAIEGDSRSQNFPEGTFVTKGEIIASAVGFPMQGNIFIDFGMYNLNTKNEASMQAGWTDKSNIDGETDPYGLCWIEFLPNDQKNLLTGLSSTVEGRYSDYCNL